jgi:hypothetical protein
MIDLIVRVVGRRFEVTNSTSLRANEEIWVPLLD